MSQWSGTSVKFGSIATNKKTDIAMLIPAAIILGVIGGALGAAFININTRANAVRKKCLPTKWSKVIETAIFGFVSASLIFWIPYFLRQ